MPADSQIEALIEAKSEAFTRLLLDGSASGEGRSAKVRRIVALVGFNSTPLTTSGRQLFVALYPIPFPPLVSRSSRAPSAPSYPARTSSPAPSASQASPSRARESSTARRTSLAAPVSSALNWLSSARAALGGDTTGSESSEPTEQDEELALAREMERTGKGCWEMWSVEIEVLRDGRRSALDGEESEFKGTMLY